jgi:hypothetical protein
LSSRSGRSRLPTWSARKGGVSRGMILPRISVPTTQYRASGLIVKQFDPSEVGG